MMEDDTEACNRPAVQAWHSGGRRVEMSTGGNVDDDCERLTSREGCRGACCVPAKKPESDEDEPQWMHTPGPSATRLTIRELKAQCAERGITIHIGDERADLEAAIAAHDEQARTGEGPSNKRRKVRPTSPPSKPPAATPATHGPTAPFPLENVTMANGFKPASAVKSELRPGFSGILSFTTKQGIKSAVRRVDWWPEGGWTCYKASIAGNATGGPCTDGKYARHGENCSHISALLEGKDGTSVKVLEMPGTAPEVEDDGGGVTDAETEPGEGVSEDEFPGEE